MNIKFLLKWGILVITVLFILSILLYIAYIPFKYLVLGNSVSSSIYTTITLTSEGEQRLDVAHHYFADLESRDLVKAEKVLLSNREIGDLDEPSLYLLSRIYFGLGYTNSVVRTANLYLEQYPDNNRMYYVRGLAGAYEEDFVQAESDFKKFIEAHPDEWAGYLDLSWVYFQNGRMNEARDTIEAGYVVAPENPWINTAYGVILYNQNEEGKATFLLKEATRYAEELDVDQWRAAYSSSDPAGSSHELGRFKELIKFNLDLIERSESVTLEQVHNMLDIPFADQSLRGIEYGLHPSACNSSCPACNVCGECNNHVHPNSCSPPALPTGYATQCFSSNNICAQNNEGTIGCSGCTATVPELPVPSPTGFYLVPDDQEVLIYEATEHTGSTLAQKCYRLNNQSGSNMFVPVKTVNEFDNFIQSSWVNSNADVDLVELAP